MRSDTATLWRVVLVSRERLTDSGRRFQHRKTRLFAGTIEDGERRAALLYSPWDSCELVDAPPLPVMRRHLYRKVSTPVFAK